MFFISARLDVNLDPNDLLHDYGLERGGRVQRFIDHTVIEDCQPYVPASPDRTLEFSAQVSTEIGEGLVIYNTPYAHYQYMGIVYGPNFQVLIKGKLEWRSYKDRPKHPTDRELTYDTSQNPMAGPHWFERSKADNLNKWLEGAERVAKMKE